jgi:uncharacterized protein (DUF1800 family)
MAARPKALDQIDPVRAWQRWEPSDADPWNRKWAAHLYRRAGFGASRADLVEAERIGPRCTLDLLVSGKPGADELLETLSDIGRIAAESDESGDRLRGWWLYTILQGGHPLREKLTLFWHNHFATSIVKVQSPMLMFRQNCLLRSHALGRFGPLLQAISRDPAMLLWLDSSSNVKGKPNENYAREVMELFSLGVGHYAETDVREAARAFTGWHTDGARFVYEERLHDGGLKTLLGQKGAWDGGDVVRIVLEQPAAARFLVGKLYRFLISEAAVPPDALLEPLCAAFRKSDYDLLALVRTMLASRHFYSEHAFRQRVKGPAEYVLGAALAVYGPAGDEEGLPPQALVHWLESMGQQLFAPPNVKGWSGGPAWLSTLTMLRRDNFAGALAMGTLWAKSSRWARPRSATAAPPVPDLLRKLAKAVLPADAPEEPPPPRAYDPARLLEEESAACPEDAARVLLDYYLPGGTPGAARRELLAFVAQGNPTGPALARRVREAVHAIMTMPEYQLA